MKEKKIYIDPIYFNSIIISFLISVIFISIYYLLGTFTLCTSDFILYDVYYALPFKKIEDCHGPIDYVVANRLSGEVESINNYFIYGGWEKTFSKVIFCIKFTFINYTYLIFLWITFSTLLIFMLKYDVKIGYKPLNEEIHKNDNLIKKESSANDTDRFQIIRWILIILIIFLIILSILYFTLIKKLNLSNNENSEKFVDTVFTPKVDSFNTLNFKDSTVSDRILDDPLYNENENENIIKYNSISDQLTISNIKAFYSLINENQHELALSIYSINPNWTHQNFTDREYGFGGMSNINIESIDITNHVEDKIIAIAKITFKFQGKASLSETIKITVKPDKDGIIKIVDYHSL